jgi:type IV pilus assembly protein PilX
MNNLQAAHRPYMLSSQSGVAMIIVLIFVVILTSLGTYALRRVLLGENLSRNALDLQVARQAAEAALRDGERDILSNGQPIPGALCNRSNDRPMPPDPNYNFSPPTWDQNCPAGQCIVGSGKRNDADPTNPIGYGSTDFVSNTGVLPWWPANTAQGDPPRWNNDFGSKPSATNVPACTTFAGGVPYGSYTAAAPIPGVIRQPEYLIEAVKTGYTVFYRVTARGWGLSTNSEAMVQSVVTRVIK